MKREQQQRPPLDRSSVRSLDEQRYLEVVGEGEVFLIHQTENDNEDDDAVSILLPYRYHGSAAADNDDDDSDRHRPRILFADEEQEANSFWAKLCRETSCSRKENNQASLYGSTSPWQYACSVGLLLFSIFLVMSAIFTKQTKISEHFSPWISCMAISILLCWLAMMEGGQGCLVGLSPVSKGIYQHSHPLTHKCAMMVQTGDNMNRFIVGRQFLVTMVVFVINLCGSAINGIALTGISDSILVLFLESGVATILMTVILGQLTAQVNAAKCMLDFVNTNFMIFTTWVSLAVETSGLLHAVYLIRYVFSSFMGSAALADEPERGGTVENITFWVRVGLSSVFLGGSAAATFAAILTDKTTMYDGVSGIASTGILLFLMCFVGLMEGLQIALFAVVKLPQEEVLMHPRAAASCELAFHGSNFQAFLIGRQICVTICTFVVARITTIFVDVNTGEQTLFGVSPRIQEFLNTGLPGALLTTILASLVWRIMASKFPIAFISYPVTYWTIRLCLVLESSGLCSAAWILARIQRYLLSYKSDEVYLGTAGKPEGSMSAETDSIASSECSTEYGSVPLSPVVERKPLLKERFTV